MGRARRPSTSPANNGRQYPAGGKRHWPAACTDRMTFLRRFMMLEPPRGLGPLRRSATRRHRWGLRAGSWRPSRSTRHPPRTEPWRGMMSWPRFLARSSAGPEHANVPARSPCRIARRCHRVAVVGHVPQQPAPGRAPAMSVRVRRVGVAGPTPGVGGVFQQHALIGHLLRRWYSAPSTSHPAQHLDVQTGRGDDDNRPRSPGRTCTG